MNEHGHGIPVIVNLAALASYDGVNDDPIQMLISGELFPGKSATTLHYIENLENEETGEITKSEIQLILAKDQVTMNRSGHYSNTMLFIKNRRYETTYHTPYGSLPMVVIPREVSCDINSKTGKVHLRYELIMQGKYASTNELHLEYWSKESEKGKK